MHQYDTIEKDTKTLPERVKALYGQPRLTTWERVGRVLRMSRGSAYSLAHGLKAPDEDVERRLELVEWGLRNRERAARNLACMLGRDCLEFD